MKSNSLINIEFGSRVRYLRTQKGLSIEELAFKCDLNKNYLGDIERGTRNPTLLIIEKISIGLDASIEELFVGIGTYKS